MVPIEPATYFLTTLVNCGLHALIDQIQILPGYRSDHSTVKLTVYMSEHRRGPGSWMLNTSHLEDQQFIDMINSTIDGEKIHA